ncbi:MAG: L,D-transpeptidase, partial [Firmicutes bacterium]|nr:L,D-transpeptidase [Bacillota bacterium]
MLWIQRALWVVAFWLIAESLAPSVIHSASPQTQGTRIVINVSQRRLYLYRGSELLGDYPVAVGKPNTRSPRGEFVITQKAVWGDGFGTRWMRISVPWGIYGIHGTNKPWTVGT